VTTRDGITGFPFLEYGGLTTVPGPFHCTDASIVLIPLRADPAKLAYLCATVLSDPTGATSYTPVGEFVLLSFGSMVVRSLSPARSRFFDTTYADMGASAERHVALWVPTVAGHRHGCAEMVERFSMFIPAMWVDNPVSIMGGRDIYGIAKQWGVPSIGHDGSGCSLDVFGGDFGPNDVSCVRRLLDVTPRSGHHVGDALREVADEAGQLVGDGLRRLLHGQVPLPDGALLTETLDALIQHTLHQVSVRQFRTPSADGASATLPELVEITTAFRTLDTRLLGHGFNVVVHHLASHPLERWLGITSQEVASGVEVTADFTLSTDATVD
jgi:hypothetical protein